MAPWFSLWLPLTSLGHNNAEISELCFPEKIINIINADKLTQPAEVGILVFTFSIQFILKSTNRSLPCGEYSFVELALYALTLVIFIAAYVANGGKNGNRFILKILTVGSLLVVWSYLYISIGIFIVYEVLPSLIESFTSLDLTDAVLFLNRNYRNVYSLAYALIFPPVFWNYFSKFERNEAA
ncbi:hypothetical protein ACFONG_04720 [Uliginosibacterium paludis]|uniref:Uncharacterized protein n=1 Tax=Uliginosibacterium paludis TaxID=1615952 RepID=A0ABV2CNA8_9RHOO